MQDAHEGAVWEEHIAALEAFLMVSTQWRLVADREGKLMASGLDYAAVKVGWKYAGVKMTPQLWDEVRMIELGARESMNGGGG